jgi:phosphotransferase system  glucose/maltose/N-acetylglucosamine-specific IIC component
MQREAAMQDETYQTLRAIRRAAGLRGFFAHLLVFAIVFCVAVLSGLDWHYFWPLTGWTIGLIFHALAAIGPGQLIGSEWEEIRIEELADKGRHDRAPGS